MKQLAVIVGLLLSSCTTEAKVMARGGSQICHAPPPLAPLCDKWHTLHGRRWV